MSNSERKYYVGFCSTCSSSIHDDSDITKVCQINGHNYCKEHAKYIADSCEHCGVIGNFSKDWNGYSCAPCEDHAVRLRNGEYEREKEMESQIDEYYQMQKQEYYKAEIEKLEKYHTKKYKRK